jgi:hypothetical protein
LQRGRHWVASVVEMSYLKAAVLRREQVPQQLQRQVRDTAGGGKLGDRGAGASAAQGSMQAWSAGGLRPGRRREQGGFAVTEQARPQPWRLAYCNRSGSPCDQASLCQAHNAKPSLAQAHWVVPGSESLSSVSPAGHSQGMTSGVVVEESVQTALPSWSSARSRLLQRAGNRRTDRTLYV